MLLLFMDKTFWKNRYLIWYEFTFYFEFQGRGHCFIISNRLTLLQSQRFPSTFLKVQHVMEISLNKRNVKGLIVALVVSDNQSLLSDLLSWTENNSKEIEVSLFIYIIMVQST